MTTKTIRLFTMLLFAALLLTGCGSPKTPVQSNLTPSAPATPSPTPIPEPQTPASPALGDTITFPTAGR